MKNIFLILLLVLLNGCLMPPPPSNYRYKLVGEAHIETDDFMSKEPQLRVRWLPKGNSDVLTSLRIKNKTNSKLLLENYVLKLESTNFEYKLVVIDKHGRTDSSDKGELLYDLMSKEKINRPKPIEIYPNQEIFVSIIFLIEAGRTEKIEFEKVILRETIQFSMEFDKKKMEFDYIYDKR